MINQTAPDFNSSHTLRSICIELVNRVQEYATAHPKHDQNDELLARARSFLETRNCWLNDGQIDPVALPDTCVIDEGQPHHCIYATELVRNNKSKLDCRYWNAGAPL